MSPGPQDYLRSAPLGVDADYAWSFRSGHGECVGFVDVEEGWYLAHPDLAYLGIKEPIFGVNSLTDWHHGTAAVGVVAGEAQNNHSGLATHLRFVGLSSVWRTSEKLDVPKAIRAGAAALRPGDVLLVEEAYYGPIELDPQVLAAIEDAVKAGIVVVEPAGNGGMSLAPSNSGAILVGAVQSSDAGARHEVLDDSNYGTGVDCYAWGEGINAPGSIVLALADAPEELADMVETDARADAYYGCFPNTSAASAIIAGVVALIQGIAQSRGLGVILPEAMRTLLRAAAGLGTAVYRNGDYQGMMPDLKKILDHLGVTPP
jgi:hypothetical protein